MDQETKGARDGHHRGYGGPWVRSAAFHLCQHGLPVSSEAPSSKAAHPDPHSGRMRPHLMGSDGFCVVKAFWEPAVASTGLVNE